MSYYSLTPNENFFSHCTTREQAIFYEMMMISDLYSTSTLSWIVIVLAHWNKQRVDKSSTWTPYSLILIPSHPIFVLTPYCRVFWGEYTNINLIVFVSRTLDLIIKTYARKIPKSWTFVNDSYLLPWMKLSEFG